MRTTHLIAVFAVSLAAACTGGIEANGTGPGSDVDPPPGIGTGSGSGSDGGSATARVYFNANVYPSLKTSCGSSGCHSATTPGANAPGFVSDTAPATDDSAAWTLITGEANVIGSFSPTAPLLSIPQNTAHFAKFSSTQVTTITDWLTLETTWRTATGGGSGSGSGVLTDYMAQFSGCMTQTDFDTAQVAKAYAQQVNTNEGYCKQCHVNGQAQSYFIATPSSTNMFVAISTYREYLSTFFTVKDNAVAVNMIPFQLAADGGPNGQHPRNWDPMNNKGMDAISQFFDLTAAHLAAGTCGAPTLSD